MIVYMDDELNFAKDELNNKKLVNLIRRYSFIFEKGNLNDLCNWFIFFFDYHISLMSNTETVIELKLIAEDNPILWANYMIYSQYYSEYHASICNKIDEIVLSKINQLGKKDILLQKEYWYVLVFINCPYIPSGTRNKLSAIVQNQRNANPVNFAQKTNNIICDFMLSPASNMFFCWGYYHFNTSKQLTFRTYQRTLFKQYKNKRSIELYGSLDT